MKHAETSKFLYCRHCDKETQHYRDLKYSWGYSCRLCQTWQHESAVLPEERQEVREQIYLETVFNRS